MINRLRRLLAAIARPLTAPLRRYVNGHFEMVKDEVRRVDESVGRIEVNGAPLVELSNIVAETELHHARVISQLRHEVTTMSARVESLDENVAQLTAVIAALVESMPSEPRRVDAS